MTFGVRGLVAALPSVRSTLRDVAEAVDCAVLRGKLQSGNKFPHSKGTELNDSQHAAKLNDGFVFFVTDPSLSDLKFLGDFTNSPTVSHHREYRLLPIA